MIEYGLGADANLFFVVVLDEPEKDRFIDLDAELAQGMTPGEETQSGQGIPVEEESAGEEREEQLPAAVTRQPGPRAWAPPVIQPTPYNRLPAPPRTAAAAAAHYGSDMASADIPEIIYKPRPFSQVPEIVYTVSSTESAAYTPQHTVTSTEGATYKPQNSQPEHEDDNMTVQQAQGLSFTHSESSVNLHQSLQCQATAELILARSVQN